MAAEQIIDVMGDLETLANDLVSQLSQLEDVINTNRTNRELILTSNLPWGELTTAVRKLDLLYLQAIRIRSTARALLRDLEDTLTLERILEYT